MNVQANSMIHQFSRAARQYASEAWMQAEVAQLLLRYLTRYTPTTPQPVRYLDVGCGSGELSAAVAALIPQSTVLGIDLAPGMIEVARERFQATSRISFQVQDILQLGQETAFDVLLSNVALQWFKPLEQAVTQMYELLAPQGLFVYSVVLRGSLGELVEVRKHLDLPVLPAEALPSATTLFSAIAAAGFNPICAQLCTLKRVYPDVDSLLHHLKQSGVTGRGDGARPMTPRQFRHFTAALSEHYGERGVPLTYRVALGVARKDAL